MKIDLHSLVPGAKALKEATNISKPEVPATGENLVSEFEKIFREQVKELTNVTSNSAKLDRDFASGKVTDIHEVMVASAKASLAVETALQLRNQTIRIFQKLSQLR